MNVATKIQPQTTDIAVVVQQTPVVVLIDKAQRESFYAHIEREVEDFVPDVSTKAGRDKIASMAFKVTKTKTAIDAAGKQLNEDARAQINAVDAERRSCKEYLTALAAKVRQPLTDWEDAEKLRIERANALIASFQSAATVTMEDTSETIRARGKQVYETEVGADLGDMADQVQAVKDGVIGTLKSALAYAIKEEADRAELEALRAAAAEREARDQAERAEQERIEQRRAWARQIIEYIGEVGLGMIGGKSYPYAILFRELEEKIVVTEEEFGDMAGDVEKARVDTLARLREAAQKQAEKSRQEAAEEAAREAREAESRKAAEALALREQQHAAALAAEKRRADELQQAAEAERQRLAKIEADRQAEADKLAAEQRKRDEDQAHRTRVKTSAKQAIMSCGADDDTARKIVMAIIAREIPHVTLAF